MELSIEMKRYVKFFCFSIYEIFIMNQRAQESKKIIKQEILESAEKLFITEGFLKFNIFELSKKTNIDSSVIRKYFLSKERMLLFILSVLYIDLFALNNSFSNAHLSLEDKKAIFSKVATIHEQKIKLFIILIERKELKYFDPYLLKLLTKTIKLHYRLFLLQFSFYDSVDIKASRVKEEYYYFVHRFKVI